MTSRMRQIVLPVIAVGVLAMACGCSPREEWVRSSVHFEASDDAPQWVKGELRQVASAKYGQGRIYFIGRGVGADVLDERGAYNAARDHALQQLAKQIATRVDVVVTESETYAAQDSEADSTTVMDKGAAFPWQRDEHMRARVSEEAMLTANALAGDLIEHESYWEEWAVNERPGRWFGCCRNVLRYKCWVLMSIARDRFERRVRETAQRLTEEAEQRLADAREDADDQTVTARREADLAALEKIYCAERDRVTACCPEALYDVVDSHSHYNSSGKNFTAGDAERVLNAARLKIANGEDFTADDAKAVLESGRGYDVFQEALKK